MSNVKVEWAYVGGKKPKSARDIWQQTDFKPAGQSYSVSVAKDGNGIAAVEIRVALSGRRLTR